MLLVNVKIHLPLDCTNIDQTTPPSKPVLTAAKTAKHEKEKEREELCHKHRESDRKYGLRGEYGSSSGSRNCSFPRTMTWILDTTSAPNYRTETQAETLDSSMLPHLNTDTALYKETKEAFCRDVNVFNIGLS